MSSAIEEEEADLRDGLRGLPLERIMLEEDDVRWFGGLVDLGGWAGGAVAGETEGNGKEGGFTRE
jgi:hypothetical protein